MCLITVVHLMYVLIVSRDFVLWCWLQAMKRAVHNSQELDMGPFGVGVGTESD